MLVIKPRMSSLKPSQVIEAMASRTRADLLRIPQPRGVVARRPMARRSREQTAQRAEHLHKDGVISTTAKNYLCEWVRGTQALQERPKRYTFLCHRWQISSDQEVPVPLSCPRLPAEPRGGRRLQVFINCCFCCVFHAVAKQTGHRFESWGWQAPVCPLRQKRMSVPRV